MISRTSTHLALCLGLAALAAPACTRDKPSGVRQNAPAAPATSATPVPTPAADPHAGMGAAPTAPAGADAIRGSVLETMDSGGYTYARIDRGGAEVWTAGPQTKLAVGDKVEAAGGSLMSGFRSETLNRTFDQIYFVGSFGGAGAAAAAPVPAADPQAGAPAPVAGTPMEKIAPAEGGTAIADVFATKDALAGKPVVVRGKVVKVNNGIMGKNWLHLQDGTGAGATADLLVTTDEVAKLGDVVVARGTLATNQDFGAGYKYDVLLESAKLAAR